MPLKRLSVLFSLAGLTTLFTTGSAHAYLDPGTASLILQGIVGAIGAGIVTLGLYWQKFTGLFRRKDEDGTGDTPSTDGAD